MGKVLEFQWPHRSESGQSRSCPQLSETLTNLTALLSRVETLQIQTTEDLRKAIFMLDLANMCIRLLIGQIPANEPAKTRLVAQAERIAQLVEATRREAAHLSEDDFINWGIANDGQAKGSPRSV